MCLFLLAGNGMPALCCAECPLPLNSWHPLHSTQPTHPTPPTAPTPSHLISRAVPAPQLPQVPASHALFTRVTGPGMIHPGTTSALEEAPPAAAAAPTAPAETPAAAAAGAAKKGKGRGGAVEVTAVAAASAAATAAKAGASSPQEGTSWDPAFPWERRALGALDYYAGVCWCVCAEWHLLSMC
jgi:hypothetical protein